MERKTYALALGYRGTGFAGWQRQPGRETVQGVLEDALASLLGERVQVHGAARTDAGVHACRQIASFSRSEEHTSELQSPCNLVCRLLLEKKKKNENTGSESTQDITNLPTVTDKPSNTAP